MFLTAFFFLSRLPIEILMGRAVEEVLEQAVERGSGGKAIACIFYLSLTALFFEIIFHKVIDAIFSQPHTEVFSGFAIDDTRQTGAAAL